MTIAQYLLAHLGPLWLESRIALVWMLANYLFFGDPACQLRNGHQLKPAWRRRWLLFLALRAAAAAVLVAWLTAGNALPTTILALGCIALPLARTCISPRYAAELEIAANLLILGLASTIAALSTPPYLAAKISPLDRELSAIAIVASIAIFVIDGGTHVVRGFLSKGGTLPALRRHSAESQAGPTAPIKLDFTEYNRGRIIGNVERLMLLAFVAAQAYQAIAFLITAKGLFRGKELEEKEFAEYFLVGTLISTLVAVAAGLAVQATLKLLW